jgi:hypothetical protein
MVEGEARMSPRRVRPVIPLTGALIIMLTVGALAIDHLVRQRSTHDRYTMVAVAATINDPRGLTTRNRGACPDQTFLIRCLEATQDPDTLAAHYRDALSASAGRSARAHCETLDVGKRPRSCLVRIDDGQHAVLVSIDSRRVGTSTGFTLSGSVVRIDAV